MRNSIDHNGRRPGRRLVLGAAIASVAWPSMGHAQGAGQVLEAQKPVSDLYDALRAIMQLGSGGASFQQRFERLAPVIDRVFDLESILHTSVGLRWSSLDQTARQSLFSVFRTFTIASYTANFDKNNGEKFEVLPQIRSSGDDVIVQSRLIPSGGDAVRIDYVMRGGAMGRQVVDVLLNGSISRVAVQRSDFRSLLASGSATPLIDSLRRKVTDLSGGTMRS